MALVVTFGHGWRHLQGTPVARVDVEHLIELDVNLRSEGAPSAFRGTVVVAGITVEYRAYRINRERFHVGTYYPL
jgi:hypothetical protein